LVGSNTIGWLASSLKEYVERLVSLEMANDKLSHERLRLTLLGNCKLHVSIGAYSTGMLPDWSISGLPILNDNRSKPDQIEATEIKSFPVGRLDFQQR
jgi:hypothetical protein